MTRRKVSTQAQTPPGTANSVQGATVLGYGHSDAAGHPTLVWVIR